MPSERDAVIEQLAELFDVTGRDWVLEVSHDLTEPTCPTAIIHVFGDNLGKEPVFRADANTIDEAIIAVCKQVYDKLLAGRAAVAGATT